MREADRLYLSKFLIDSDSSPSPMDGQGHILNENDLFRDDGDLDDIGFDQWFDME